MNTMYYRKDYKVLHQIVLQLNLNQYNRKLIYNFKVPQLS